MHAEPIYAKTPENPPRCHVSFKSSSEDEESSYQANQKDYSVMKKPIQRLQSENGIFS
jgi:hypothetical protein